jgi:hypothetical protein
MKTCSDGHENADDADQCVVCGKILPGNSRARATGSLKDNSEQTLEARAKRWVEGYGLVWEDLNFAEKDIFKRANKANATVAMIEMAQLKAGKIKGEALYEPKPKSGRVCSRTEEVAQGPGGSGECVTWSMCAGGTPRPTLPGSPPRPPSREAPK